MPRISQGETQKPKSKAKAEKRAEATDHASGLFGLTKKDKL